MENKSWERPLQPKAAPPPKPVAAYNYIPVHFSSQSPNFGTEAGANGVTPLPAASNVISTEVEALRRELHASQRETERVRAESNQRMSRLEAMLGVLSETAASAQADNDTFGFGLQEPTGDDGDEDKDAGGGDRHRQVPPNLGTGEVTALLRLRDATIAQLQNSVRNAEERNEELAERLARQEIEMRSLRSFVEQVAASGGASTHSLALLPVSQTNNHNSVSPSPTAHTPVPPKDRIPGRTAPRYHRPGEHTETPPSPTRAGAVAPVAKNVDSDDGKSMEPKAGAIANTSAAVAAVAAVAADANGDAHAENDGASVLTTGLAVEDSLLAATQKTRLDTDPSVVSMMLSTETTAAAAAAHMPAPISTKSASKTAETVASAAVPIDGLAPATTTATTTPVEDVSAVSTETDSVPVVGAPTVEKQEQPQQQQQKSNTSRMDGFQLDIQRNNKRQDDTTDAEIDAGGDVGGGDAVETGLFVRLQGTDIRVRISANMDGTDIDNNGGGDETAEAAIDGDDGSEAKRTDPNVMTLRRVRQKIETVASLRRRLPESGKWGFVRAGGALVSPISDAENVLSPRDIWIRGIRWDDHPPFQLEKIDVRGGLKPYHHCHSAISTVREIVLGPQGIWSFGDTAVLGITMEYTRAIGRLLAARRDVDTIDVAYKSVAIASANRLSRDPKQQMLVDDGTLHGVIIANDAIQDTHTSVGNETDFAKAAKAANETLATVAAATESETTRIIEILQTSLQDNSVELLYVDNLGRNALHHACSCGDVRLVKVLLTAAPGQRILSLLVNQRDRLGRVPLGEALRNNHVEAAIAVFDSRVANVALKSRSYGRKYEIVEQRACDNGTDNTRAEFEALAALREFAQLTAGETAAVLRGKCCVGDTDWLFKFFHAHPSIPSAVIDAHDECVGVTALHLAAQQGSVVNVSMLLKAKACPMVRDWRGRTPLHVACSNSNVEVAMVICSQGSLWCPPLSATEGGSGAEGDGAGGVDAEHQNNKAIGSGHGGGINAIDHYFNTPFHLWGWRKGILPSPELLEYLLTPLSALLYNKSGFTALQNAVLHGHAAAECVKSAVLGFDEHYGHLFEKCCDLSQLSLEGQDKLKATQARNEAKTQLLDTLIANCPWAPPTDIEIQPLYWPVQNGLPVGLAFQARLPLESTLEQDMGQIKVQKAITEFFGADDAPKPEVLFRNRFMRRLEQCLGEKPPSSLLRCAIVSGNTSLARDLILSSSKPLLGVDDKSTISAARWYYPIGMQFLAGDRGGRGRDYRTRDECYENGVFQRASVDAMSSCGFDRHGLTPDIEGCELEWVFRYDRWGSNEEEKEIHQRAVAHTIAAYSQICDKLASASKYDCLRHVFSQLVFTLAGLDRWSSVIKLLESVKACSGKDYELCLSPALSFADKVGTSSQLATFPNEYPFDQGYETHANVDSEKTKKSMLGWRSLNAGQCIAVVVALAERTIPYIPDDADGDVHKCIVDLLPGSDPVVTCSLLLRDERVKNVYNGMVARFDMFTVNDIFTGESSHQDAVVRTEKAANWVVRMANAILGNIDQSLRLQGHTVLTSEWKRIAMAADTCVSHGADPKLFHDVLLALFQRCCLSNDDVSDSKDNDDTSQNPLTDTTGDKGGDGLPQDEDMIFKFRVETPFLFCCNFRRVSCTFRAKPFSHASLPSIARALLQAYMDPASSFAGPAADVQRMRLLVLQGFVKSCVVTQGVEYLDCMSTVPEAAAEDEIARTVPLLLPMLATQWLESGDPSTEDAFKDIHAIARLWKAAIVADPQFYLTTKAFASGSFMFALMPRALRCGHGDFAYEMLEILLPMILKARATDSHAKDTTTAMEHCSERSTRRNIAFPVLTINDEHILRDLASMACIAAQHNQKTFVLTVIPAITDATHKTCILEAAAKAGHGELCVEMLSIAKLAVRPSAAPVSLPPSPNRRYPFVSPLHHACARGLFEAIYPMLANGASLSDKDNVGLSPLDYAVTMGQISCLASMLVDRDRRFDGSTEFCIFRNNLRIGNCSKSRPPQVSDSVVNDDDDDDDDDNDGDFRGHGGSVDMDTGVYERRTTELFHEVCGVWAPRWFRSNTDTLSYVGRVRQAPSHPWQDRDQVRQIIGNATNNHNDALGLQIVDSLEPSVKLFTARLVNKRFEPTLETRDFVECLTRSVQIGRQDFINALLEGDNGALWDGATKLSVNGVDREAALDVFTKQMREGIVKMVANVHASNMTLPSQPLSDGAHSMQDTDTDGMISACDKALTLLVSASWPKPDGAFSKLGGRYICMAARAGFLNFAVAVLPLLQFDPADQNMYHSPIRALWQGACFGRHGRRALTLLPAGYRDGKVLLKRVVTIPKCSDVVTALLTDGVEFDAEGDIHQSDKDSALCAALQTGDSDVVLALLQHGASPEVASGEALMVAARRGCGRGGGAGTAAVIDALAAAGCKSSIDDENSVRPYTEMEEACRRFTGAGTDMGAVDVLRALQRAGCSFSVNARNTFGFHPLDTALVASTTAGRIACDILHNTELREGGGEAWWVTLLLGHDAVESAGDWVHSVGPALASSSRYDACHTWLIRSHWSLKATALARHLLLLPSDFNAGSTVHNYTVSGLYYPFARPLSLGDLTRSLEGSHRTTLVTAALQSLVGSIASMPKPVSVLIESLSSTLIDQVPHTMVLEGARAAMASGNLGVARCTISFLGDGSNSSDPVAQVILDGDAVALLRWYDDTVSEIRTSNLKGSSEIFVDEDGDDIGDVEEDREEEETKELLQYVLRLEVDTVLELAVSRGGLGHRVAVERGAETDGALASWLLTAAQFAMWQSVGATLARQYDLHQKGETYDGSKQVWELVDQVIQRLSHRESSLCAEHVVSGLIALAERITASSSRAHLNLDSTLRFAAAIGDVEACRTLIECPCLPADQVSLMSDINVLELASDGVSTLPLPVWKPSDQDPPKGIHGEPVSECDDRAIPLVGEMSGGLFNRLPIFYQIPDNVLDLAQDDDMMFVPADPDDWLAASRPKARSDMWLVSQLDTWFSETRAGEIVIETQADKRHADWIPPALRMLIEEWGRRNVSDMVTAIVSRGKKRVSFSESQYRVFIGESLVWLDRFVEHDFDEVVMQVADATIGASNIDDDGKSNNGRGKVVIFPRARPSCSDLYKMFVGKLCGAYIASQSTQPADIGSSGDGNGDGGGRITALQSRISCGYSIISRELMHWFAKCPSYLQCLSLVVEDPVDNCLHEMLNRLSSLTSLEIVSQSNSGSLEQSGNAWETRVAVQAARYAPVAHLFDAAATSAATLCTLTIVLDLSNRSRSNGDVLHLRGLIEQCTALTELNVSRSYFDGTQASELVRLVQEGHPVPALSSAPAGRDSAGVGSHVASMVMVPSVRLFCGVQMLYENVDTLTALTIDCTSWDSVSGIGLYAVAALVRRLSNLVTLTLHRLAPCQTRSSQAKSHDKKFLAFCGAKNLCHGDWAGAASQKLSNAIVSHPSIETVVATADGRADIVCPVKSLRMSLPPAVWWSERGAEIQDWPFVFVLLHMKLFASARAPQNGDTALSVPNLDQVPHNVVQAAWRVGYVNSDSDTSEPVTSLKLDDMALGSTGAVLLAKALRGQTDLTSLSLSNCSVVPSEDDFDGLRGLILSIQHAVNLTNLDLTHNSLSADDARNLVNSVRGLTSLKSLCRIDVGALRQGAVSSLTLCNTSNSEESSRTTEGHVVSRFERCTEAEVVMALAEAGTRPQALKELNLSVGVTTLPGEIGALTSLTKLDLKGCGGVTRLPVELVDCQQLATIVLYDANRMTFPPSEICRKGTHEILRYLKNSMSERCQSYRLKLMIVGLGEAGKTSLIRALKSPFDKAGKIAKDDRTVGIDIDNWQPMATNPIIFKAWDFAGQRVYYSTHQFFLTHRAVYTLVWRAFKRAQRPKLGPKPTDKEQKEYDAAMTETCSRCNKLLWVPECTDYPPKAEDKLHEPVKRRCNRCHQPARHSGVVYKVEDDGRSHEECCSYDRLVGDWLHKLQMRVPGVSVVLVATHCEKDDHPDVIRQCLAVKHLVQLSLKREQKLVDGQLRRYDQQLNELSDKGAGNSSEYAKTLLQRSRLANYKRLDIWNDGYSEAVDSRKGKGISKLRAVLLAIADRLPFVGETVPSAYFKLLASVEEYRKSGTQTIPIAQFKDVGVGVGLNPRDATAAASFWHDLGELLYFPGITHLLDDTIFLNPRYIIDVLKALVCHHIKPGQRQVLLDEAARRKVEVMPIAVRDALLRKLNRDGNLDPRLCDILWPGEDGAIIIDLLKAFEVLVEDGQGRLMVPCLLTGARNRPMDANAFESDSTTFRCRFVYSSLPDGFFSRLSARCSKIVKHSRFSAAAAAYYSRGKRTLLFLCAVDAPATVFPMELGTTMGLEVDSDMPQVHVLLAAADVQHFQAFAAEIEAMEEFFQGLVRIAALVPCPSCTTMSQQTAMATNGETVPTPYHFKLDALLEKSSSGDSVTREDEVRCEVEAVAIKPSVILPPPAPAVVLSFCSLTEGAATVAATIATAVERAASVAVTRCSENWVSDTHSGVDFQTVVRRAAIFVLLLDDSYANSEMCRALFNIAVASNRKIIPLITSAYRGGKLSFPKWYPESMPDLKHLIFVSVNSEVAMRKNMVGQVLPQINKMLDDISAASRNDARGDGDGTQKKLAAGPDPGSAEPTGDATSGSGAASAAIVPCTSCIAAGKSEPHYFVRSDLDERVSTIKEGKRKVRHAAEAAAVATAASETAAKAAEEADKDQGQLRVAAAKAAADATAAEANLKAVLAAAATEDAIGDTEDEEEGEEEEVLRSLVVHCPVENSKVTVVIPSNDVASTIVEAIPCPSCVMRGSAPPFMFDRDDVVQQQREAAEYAASGGAEGHGGSVVVTIGQDADAVRRTMLCELEGIEIALSDILLAEVFISYNWGSKDGVHHTQKHVVSLKSRLEADIGITCWLDIERMGGGQRLDDEMEAGVRHAALILVCIDPAYMKSVNCMKEFAFACRYKKAIQLVYVATDPHWVPQKIGVDPAPGFFTCDDVIHMEAKLARLQKTAVRLPVGMSLEEDDIDIAIGDLDDRGIVDAAHTEGATAAVALRALTSKIQGRFFRGKARAGTEFVAHTRKTKWTRSIVSKIKSLGRTAAASKKERVVAPGEAT